MRRRKKRVQVERIVKSEKMIATPQHKAILQVSENKTANAQEKA
jgi:hypothetical protein